MNPLTSGNKDAPSITAGESIPYVKKPFLGRLRANKVIALCNAILKARIQTVTGAGSRVFFGSTGGMVIQVDLNPAGTLLNSYFWQTPKKELDPTIVVKKGTFVYISSLNNLVVTGLTDLVSLTITKSSSGIWQAAQDVPAKTVVSGGATDKYNVPVVPVPGSGGTPSGSPLSGDFDGANVFWLPWGGSGPCDQQGNFIG